MSMSFQDAKAIASGCFPTINGATEWVMLPEPVCVVESSAGEKFSVVAQKYGSKEMFFCGDFYSSPNICFIYLGDQVDEVPESKGGYHG